MKIIRAIIAILTAIETVTIRRRANARASRAAYRMALNGCR